MQFPPRSNTRFEAGVPSTLKCCPEFPGRESPGGRASPEVVIGSTHHHHAVVRPDLLPEILHGFHVALQGVLPDDEEHRGLHLQEGVIHILQQGWDGAEGLPGGRPNGIY